MTIDDNLENELRSIGSDIVSAPPLTPSTVRRINHRRGRSMVTMACLVLLLGAAGAISIRGWVANSPISREVTPAHVRKSPDRILNAWLGGGAWDLRKGWHRAPSQLTPQQNVDYQVVAAGTGAFHVGGGRCPRLPVTTLEALRPTDAFFDLTRDPFANTGDFAERPSDFRQLIGTSVDGGRNVQHCVSNPAIAQLHWLAFYENGIFFHLLIAEGRRVSPRIETQLWHSVNTILLHQ
jgi:hypothetical protein